MTPPIWFGLATYYKRVSALFYDQRKEIFTALILFEIELSSTSNNLTDSGLLASKVLIVFKSDVSNIFMLVLNLFYLHKDAPIR